MKSNTNPKPNLTGVPRISDLRCGIAAATLTICRVPHISHLRCGIVAASLALCLPAYSADSLASANAALQAGKADEATRLLSQDLKANPNNPEANNLLCRVEFAVQHFDPAAEHCQKAVSADPNNARYHLWLGRAIGERASRASFLSAYSLAKKTREEFETAVKLDPHDVEALSDLGEFDKEAPGAVGGGLDKAEDVAKKLDPVDPSRAHILRAEIAEKQKNLPEAEQQYKAATTGPHSAIAWMELANFYRRHERWSDLDSAVDSGASAASKEKHSAIALANGAGILARANRSPNLAIKLYTEYLASPDRTEEAPAFEVLTKLARLREKNGDHAGAQRDQAAAQALAHDYKPAQDISPQEHKH
jgi:tetratricopeptide (TPR) repeat protein